MKSHDLHNLAVIFRCNYDDVNHVSTFELITQAGLAYSYGVMRGTPERYTRKRRQMRERIAEALEKKAQEAQQ
jgi:hypothetical protein